MVKPKAKEHAADERGKLEARLRHERLIQQPEFQSLFVSQQHHQCMSSNGKLTRTRVTRVHR